MKIMGYIKKAKLSERTDEAGKKSLEVVNIMFSKLFELKILKKKEVKNRDDAIAKMREDVKKAEHNFNKKLLDIDRDIYNFENSIKNLCGAADFYKLKDIYKKAHKETADIEKTEEELKS